MCRSRLRAPYTWRRTAAISGHYLSLLDNLDPLGLRRVCAFRLAELRFGRGAGLPLRGYCPPKIAVDFLDVFPAGIGAGRLGIAAYALPVRDLEV